MLFDNRVPRYLPHLDGEDLLAMGLSPMDPARWIEPDGDAARYHHHKLQQRERLGERVHRARADSLPARRELAALLLDHLLADHPDCYRREGETLHCLPGNFRVALVGPEPLWRASLWVADDLVIMEPREGAYRLTAASLCSASGWRLEDKFDGSLAAVHGPVPDFDRVLLPSVERFFGHLKVERPVVRYNWSLQQGGKLNRRPGREGAGELHYRVERQSLRRLPETGAVVFGIRVYLHPLASLRPLGEALPRLLEAVDRCPPALRRYKGFDRLAPLLEEYR